MLTSIFSQTSSSIELTDVLICSACSIILGVLIAYTHKITSKYSKNFLITISVLPLLVQIVILMVNGNLGTSVAVVGAFGLVRFRSLPGTSKEILTVFFAMAIGLATGMGHIGLAIIGTIIGCVIIILFNKVTIFDINKKEKILKVSMPEDLDYTTVFDDIFEKYTKKVELEQVKSTNMGSMFDLKYLITLKKDANEKEFIDEIRTRNGNLKIILTHSLEENDL